MALSKNASDRAAQPRPAGVASGRLLLRNTVLNLAGLVVPTLVALWAVPLLISGYGTERFALLTIAWLVIGHATVFDLGMGRALTRAVAEQLGRGDWGGIPRTVWTAVGSIAALGVAFGALLYVLAPWLGGTVLQLSPALAEEAVSGLRWLGLGMPAVVATAALRGLLEAQQRFGLVTLLRIPGGALMFVAPLLVLLFSQRFDVAVVALVLVRTGLTAAYLGACLSTLPALRSRIVVAREELQGLVRFGGWTTVAAGVAVAMDYTTRLFIGAMMPIAFVAYFATPADILVKLLVVPAAVLGVLFPAITVYAATDRARAAGLVGRGAVSIFLLMFPVTAVVVAASYQLLYWWIDAEFAAASAPALQWLAIGGLVNAIASMAASALGGINRPELAALPALFQLPFFVLAVWWVLAAGMGVAAVAAVVAVRAAVDGLLLYYLLQKVLPLEQRMATLLAGLSSAGLVVLGAIVLLPSVQLSLLLAGVAALAFLAVAWKAGALALAGDAAGSVSRVPSADRAQGRCGAPVALPEPDGQPQQDRQHDHLIANEERARRHSRHESGR